MSAPIAFLSGRARRGNRAACAGVLFLIPLVIAIVTIRAQDSAPSQRNTKTPSITGELVISPNLEKEVAKFKTVQMPFDTTHLTERERQMVGKLVEACQDLESIYWRQSDPEGLKLYQSLAGSRAPKDVALRRFLRINGSRFDLIDNDAS